MTDIYTYQDAITAGGIVTVPPGAYTQSAPLLLPLDTSLTLNGYGVTVTLDAACPGGCIEFASEYDYQIFRDITIRGFTIDASAVTADYTSQSVIGTTRLGTHSGISWMNNLHDILIEDLDITLPASLTDPADYDIRHTGVHLGSRQSSTSLSPSNVERITVHRVKVHGGDQAVVIAAARGYGAANCDEQGVPLTPWAGNLVWMDDISVIDCDHVATVGNPDHLLWGSFHIGSVSHGGSVLVSNCTSYGAGEGGFEVNGFNDTVIEHCDMTDSGAVGFMFYNFNDRVDAETQTILFDDCHAINTGPLVYTSGGTWPRVGFDHIATYGTDTGAITFNNCTAATYSEGYDFYVLGCRSVVYTDNPTPPTPPTSPEPPTPSTPPAPVVSKCPDKYDLIVTYDGVSHGLLCDWTQKGVGLQIDPPQIPQSTQVSTKGNYGVRDANDFFRIVQTDWVEGCGQNTYDSDDDSASAFLASTNADISDKGSLRLGPATTFTADRKTSSASCAGLVDGSGNPLVWRGIINSELLPPFSPDGAVWPTDWLRSGVTSETGIAYATGGRFALQEDGVSATPWFYSPHYAVTPGMDLTFACHAQAVKLIGGADFTANYRFYDEDGTGIGDATSFGVIHEAASYDAEFLQGSATVPATAAFVNIVCLIVPGTGTSYCYVWDVEIGETAANGPLYSKDGKTWTRPTAHTYHTTAAPTSLCTDGAYVYGCFGGVVSKSTIADTLLFSTDGSNAALTHVSFASGTLYGAKATQLGAFSQVAQPVWTALSPIVGSAINTEAGTTFGLVSSGNYVYWGVTNGMVTKVYKALYAGGAAKDELTAVATFPTGFVGSSLHAYLGTVYVGGHFDAETAGDGIGAIYAIINDSPSLLTNVGDPLARTDKTQKWGVISITSYERSLYFLTGNGHVYRWDLVNGGYSHVMDVDTGEEHLSVPASWTKTWTMAAAPASPAVITNVSTTAVYDGTLKLSQNYSEDHYWVQESVAFDDSVGETLEVDLPANAIVTTNPHLRSGILGFGIFGEVKDVRVRVWTTATAAADYMGEMRTGNRNVIASFGPLSRDAATLRLTLKGTDAVLSCDGSVIAHGTASVARDAGDIPGVWIRATDPNPAGNATITDFMVDEVRWSTAGIFDASFMPTITGSSIVCARDKVFALCQDATLGGCQVTSTTEYASSGSLTSSKSSGNMPTVDKYFNRIDVQLERLPTDCGLTALVTIDGTSAGPIEGTVTGLLMSFPVGVLGRTISHRLNLTTEDSLQTPVVSETATLFTAAPKTAKVYTYMVKCWDKVADNNGGDWDEKASVVADFLEEIANTIVTVSRPGQADYTGKVEGVQYLEAPPSRKANGREGIYQVSVRSVDG